MKSDQLLGRKTTTSMSCKMVARHPTKSPASSYNGNKWKSSTRASRLWNDLPHRVESADKRVESVRQDADLCCCSRPGPRCCCCVHYRSIWSESIGIALSDHVKSTRRRLHTLVGCAEGEWAAHTGRSRTRDVEREDNRPCFFYTFRFISLYFKCGIRSLDSAELRLLTATQSVRVEERKGGDRRNTEWVRKKTMLLGWRMRSRRGEEEGCKANKQRNVSRVPKLENNLNAWLKKAQICVCQPTATHLSYVWHLKGQCDVFM